MVNKEGLEGNGCELNGNFSETVDDFTATLDYRWSFIRTPRSQWWGAEDGKLVITPQPVSIAEVANPAFIGRRQQHLAFESSVCMSYVPGKETLATLPCNSKDVALKVVGEGRLYSFYFSDDKMKTWNTVYENADASILSTNRAGGFTGTMIGMYASGQHK